MNGCETDAPKGTDSYLNLGTVVERCEGLFRGGAVFETAAFNRSATSPLVILPSAQSGGKPAAHFAASPSRSIIAETETRRLEAK